MPISAPFLSQSRNVPAIMRQVLYALLPGIFVYTYLAGIGVLINLLLAILFCAISESVFSFLRGQDALDNLKDYSTLVSACLLALCLPPLLPWWITAIASLFSIVVGKQLYGGLGLNPFNPAMLGYVVVFISFPQAMTRWLDPIQLQSIGLYDSLMMVLQGQASSSSWDAISQATPLDSLRTQLHNGFIITEAQQGWLILQNSQTWLALSYAAGGIWLYYRRVINWQIPLFTLLGLLLPAVIFYWLNPQHYASPWFHLFNGATMLCAFFIATDPVSAASSDKGRIIYAFGIGLIAYLIRSFGGYPDGFAFAVLLMNLAAPTIDMFTKPRIYGHH